MAAESIAAKIPSTSTERTAQRHTVHTERKRKKSEHQIAAATSHKVHNYDTNDERPATIQTAIVRASKHKRKPKKQNQTTTNQQAKINKQIKQRNKRSKIINSKQSKANERVNNSKVNRTSKQNDKQQHTQTANKQKQTNKSKQIKSKQKLK